MKSTEIYLLVIGMSIGFISLSINQLFPYQFSVASLVSPTGAQFTVSGIRIKHWVVGVFLTVFAYLSYATSKKVSPLKYIGLVMMGAGTILVIDEYEAVIKFLTTGAYP